MSSISSACIKAEAEAAALSAMAAILKEKHALECEEHSLAAARQCEEDSLAAARKCEEDSLAAARKCEEDSLAAARRECEEEQIRQRKEWLELQKFIPQGSEGQFNPSPKGGRRAVVSVETLHKDANLQYHNPTEEDKNFALSMGAHPKDSNQLLHHPPDLEEAAERELRSFQGPPQNFQGLPQNQPPGSSYSCPVEMFTQQPPTHLKDRSLSPWGYV
ncbi:hypothetical protein F7725_022322 [Dissostichus mawsoni]|uniref:Uncharacterized protein n=1 Tax=Dissostichus mawsoni TaxID=36200 RepID=A0A7J5Z0G6_DISMA|nr:hypothetical protein F7725_022322 [Dissostichus mawsoni]